MGNFSEDSTALWTIDKKLHWDFDFKGEIVKETAFINYYNHSVDDVTVLTDELDKHNQQNLAAIEQFTGKNFTNSSSLLPEITVNGNFGL